MFGIIYIAINSVNGKYYIGKSTQSLAMRISQHQKDSRRLDLYFYRSFKTHGFEKFRWHELDHANSEEELDFLERYYIDFYSSHIKEIGYNSTYGGDGGNHNTETREKISASRKGRFTGESNPFYGKRHSEEIMEKIKEKWRNRTPEQVIEWKKNIGEGNRGKIKSSETLKKISESQKGRKKSELHKDRLRASNRGKLHEKVKGELNGRALKVQCIETGEVFGTAKEAAESKGANAANIRSCCKGRRKMSGNLHWKYFEVDEKL